MQSDKEYRARLRAAMKADPDGKLAARKIRKMRADRRARAIAREGARRDKQPE